MTIEIKVPQLPESVADATLVAWHKQPGDAVTRDENLADLETDKVVLEVPAPVNGVLQGDPDSERHHGDQRPGAGRASRKVRPRPRAGCAAAPASGRRQRRDGCAKAAARRAAGKDAASSARPCAGWSRRTSSIPAPIPASGKRRPPDEVGRRRISSASSASGARGRRHSRAAAAPAAARQPPARRAGARRRAHRAARADDAPARSASPSAWSRRSPPRRC